MIQNFRNFRKKKSNFYLLKCNEIKNRIEDLEKCSKCKLFVYKGLHIRVSHLAIGWHCQLDTHRSDPLWHDSTFKVGHSYVCQPLTKWDTLMWDPLYTMADSKSLATSMLVTDIGDPIFWWQASDNVTIFGCHLHRCSLSSKHSRNCIKKREWQRDVGWCDGLRMLVTGLLFLTKDHACRV